MNVFARSVQRYCISPTELARGPLNIVAVWIPGVFHSAGERSSVRVAHLECGLLKSLWLECSNRDRGLSCCCCRCCPPAQIVVDANVNSEMESMITISSKMMKIYMYAREAEFVVYVYMCANMCMAVGEFGEGFYAFTSSVRVVQYSL